MYCEPHKLPGMVKLTPTGSGGDPIWHMPATYMLLLSCMRLSSHLG